MRSLRLPRSVRQQQTESLRCKRRSTSRGSLLRLPANGVCECLVGIGDTESEQDLVFGGYDPSVESPWSPYAQPDVYELLAKIHCVILITHLIRTDDLIR